MPASEAALPLMRRSPEQQLVALHNTTEHRQVWPRWAVPLGGPLHDVLSGDVFPEGSDVVLEPYAVRWLVR